MFFYLKKIVKCKNIWKVFDGLKVLGTVFKRNLEVKNKKKIKLITKNKFE